MPARVWNLAERPIHSPVLPHCVQMSSRFFPRESLLAQRFK
jgi:hypothetical protein